MHSIPRNIQGTMFVNISHSPAKITSEASPSACSSGRNRDYYHSERTLNLLDYLFSLYKQLDSRPLDTKFSATSTLFLSQKQMDRLIQSLQNIKGLGARPPSQNPIIHFKKLYMLRQLILSIVNRKAKPLLIGENLDEFEYLFSSEDFYPAIKDSLKDYIELNTPTEQSDRQAESFQISPRLSDRLLTQSDFRRP